MGGGISSDMPKGKKPISSHIRKKKERGTARHVARLDAETGRERRLSTKKKWLLSLVPGRREIFRVLKWEGGESQ